MDGGVRRLEAYDGFDVSVEFGGGVWLYFSRSSRAS